MVIHSLMNVGYVVDMVSLNIILIVMEIVKIMVMEMNCVMKLIRVLIFQLVMI